MSLWMCVCFFVASFPNSIAQGWCHKNCGPQCPRCLAKKMQQTTCIMANTNAFVHVNVNKNSVRGTKIDLKFIEGYSNTQFKRRLQCRGLASGNQTKVIKRYVWRSQFFRADPCSVASVMTQMTDAFHAWYMPLIHHIRQVFGNRNKLFCQQLHFTLLAGVKWKCSWKSCNLV